MSSLKKTNSLYRHVICIVIRLNSVEAHMLSSVALKFNRVQSPFFMAMPFAVPMKIHQDLAKLEDFEKTLCSAANF